MSVVVSARVEVENCTPQLLVEAAKILSKAHKVTVTRIGSTYAVRIDGVSVRVEENALVASAGENSQARDKLNHVLSLARDAVIAVQVLNTAKATGRNASVSVGERGIAVEVW